MYWDMHTGDFIHDFAAGCELDDKIFRGNIGQQPLGSFQVHFKHTCQRQCCSERRRYFVCLGRSHEYRDYIHVLGDTPGAVSRPS